MALSRRGRREAEFEALYGADGDWARLFRRSADYLGTALSRETSTRRASISPWADGVAGSYDGFLRAHRDDDMALDVRGDALTLAEERLGALENR